MNRLIISAIGVILTFIWIVYTAPPRQDKLEKPKTEQIKTISKSGSASLNTIKQPVYKRVNSYDLKAGNSLVSSKLQRR